jgi:hypothetical protein
MKGSIVFVIAFALVFYTNGAAFIEGFLNYSSWHLIGPAEFQAFHKFITPRGSRVLGRSRSSRHGVFDSHALVSTSVNTHMVRMLGDCASNGALGLFSNDSNSDTTQASDSRSIHPSSRSADRDELVAATSSIRHYGSTVPLDDDHRARQRESCWIGRATVVACRTRPADKRF